MKHLILDTNGLIVRKRNQCFNIISKQRGQRMISPKRIKSITILKNVSLNSSVIHLAIDNEIPIYIANGNGSIKGIVRYKSLRGNATLRHHQHLWVYSDDAQQWARDTIKVKLRQQSKLLIKFGSKVGKMDQNEDINIDENITIAGLRVHEAVWGKRYWEAYRLLLPTEVIMGARNVRPAQDVVNALINYFYGFLYTLVEQAVWANGLDPYIAVVHQNPYQTPVLTFDLIEPYRTMVDTFVLEECKATKNMTSYLIETKTGIQISKACKKELIPKFLKYQEKKVSIEGYTTTYYKHVYRAVYMLRQRIETNHEEVLDIIRHRK